MFGVKFGVKVRYMVKKEIDPPAQASNFGR